MVRNIGKNYGNGKVGGFQEICMIFFADVFLFGEDFIAIWDLGNNVCDLEFNGIL